MAPDENFVECVSMGLVGVVWVVVCGGVVLDDDIGAFEGDGVDGEAVGDCVLRLGLGFRLGLGLGLGLGSIGCELIDF